MCESETGMQLITVVLPCRVLISKIVCSLKYTLVLLCSGLQLSESNYVKVTFGFTSL